MDNVKSLKVCVLSSGSKGNCTLVSTASTKILIDLGRSCAYITAKLKELDVDSKDINAVLITHSHNDHTNGLKVFVNKFHPKVYLTESMYEDLKELLNYEDCIFIEEPFEINDLEIDYIKTSHDTDDSNGYIIKNKKESLVYITDTGYINQKYNNKLKNHSIYIMESNHDIKMLMEGSYPHYLKQRILSDRGHLSNEDSAINLAKYIGSKTKYIILAHLSEENNTKEKAYSTLIDTLNKKNIKFDNIIVATQEDKTEVIEV